MNRATPAAPKYADRFHQLRAAGYSLRNFGKGLRHFAKLLPAPTPEGHTHHAITVDGNGNTVAEQTLTLNAN
jgi:hypothetical protein